MNFLNKIFSPIALSVSFFLLIYTFYQSEIYFNGEKRHYYLAYYVISLILICFSTFTFFISQKIKEYLIIIGISLVVSLYVFEAYLTFKIFSLSKELFYEKQTGKKWDTRSRFEIYNDLKKENNDIVVEISPYNYLERNFQIFPFSGVSNSETIYCNENGYYSIYHSDRYGFNNPDKEWDKGEIEYLLVGDSYTHGGCVNRPDDIASVIRNSSNRSVLNLGYASNGPLIEYVTLREYLDLNVKKVLWMYNEGNDFRNLNDELKDKTLKNYLNDLTFSQNLKLKQKEINNLALNIIEEKIREKDEKQSDNKPFRLKIPNFFKIANTRTLIFPPTQSKPQQEFKEILKLTKKLANKNNSKLYFVYLPEWTRYKKNYSNTNYKLVKKIVNELNITLIDIHEEVFKKENNPLSLFSYESINGHYNVIGHKKVGETIYRLTKD
jgi:hypothetical protein